MVVGRAGRREHQAPLQSIVSLVEASSPSAGIFEGSRGKEGEADGACPLHIHM